MSDFKIVGKDIYKRVVVTVRLVDSRSIEVGKTVDGVFRLWDVIRKGQSGFTIPLPAFCIAEPQSNYLMFDDLAKLGSGIHEFWFKEQIDESCMVKQNKALPSR